MRGRFSIGGATWIVMFALLVLPWQACANELKPWTGGATPALALRDAGGNGVSLADYRGKVLLVNFWATWCEPCREEMPSLERLQAQLAGKPFAILAVNIGESESRVANFLERVNVGLKVLFDKDTRAARQWKVRVLPATFVVGPRGEIRYWQAGEAQWDSPAMVAALLRLMPGT